jgi:protein tyrosine/serine phosphatase
MDNRALKILGIFFITSFIFPVVHAQQFQRQESRPPAFRRVTPLVFAGGRPSEDNLSFLKEKGIKTIVNLQGGNYGINPFFNSIVEKREPGETPQAIRGEIESASKIGINERNFPLNSFFVGRESIQNIKDVLDVLANAKEPVYVHCQNGIDRTGLVISIFRVTQLKESKEKVLNDWLELREGRATAALTLDLVHYFESNYIDNPH